MAAGDEGVLLMNNPALLLENEMTSGNRAMLALLVTVASCLYLARR